MPQWMPIRLFSTGVGLKEGDEDPHWQIVARSDDPHFKPRPAVVTWVDVWIDRENDPSKSQWISMDNGPPNVPAPVTYTFRTTFELAGMVPGAAVLEGRFIADNHVDAIRLNGKAIPVAKHGRDYPFYQCTGFSIRDGFVEGSNVLEFDVRNDRGERDPPEGNPMLLRVELSGDVLAGYPTTQERPRGKEGAPMNGP